MSCSIAKVSDIYKNVRAFCRENPGCTSLYEARIRNDLIYGTKWDLYGGLTKKEEKALELKCKWLGV